MGPLVHTPGHSSVETAESGQLGLIVLAAVALLVSASLAAGIGGPLFDPAPPSPDEPESSGIDSVSIDWERVIDLIEQLDLEWILDLFEPDTDSGSEPACTVALSNQPTPGAETTVYIQSHGSPVTDAAVWFNGNYIGDTDARGMVTGTIPYERELVVEVAAPDGTTCVGSDSIRGAQMGALSTHPQVSQTENSSIQYDVRGDVTIDIRDRPYPGDAVGIRASINGRPFAGASVTVDGEERGTTDSGGRATVILPADGREAVQIAASRGEFEGSVRVELLILDARIEPERLAPLPGSPGAVVAEVGGDPIAGATVSIDGEPIGTTDGAGRIPVVIPADPMTPVTVTTEHQSTTFTLLEQLLPLLGILGVVVCVGGVVASRWLGWRGPVLLVGGVVSVIAVLTAEAYWGTRGGLLAAGLVLLPWVVLVARQWFHHGALSTRDIDRSILERVIERVYALLFWVVDGIDHCIDLLIGLGHTGVRAIRALSVRSLLSNPLAAVVSGLGRLGGQLVAARWMILVGTAVLGLLISGYVVGDVIGLLVTAGGLMVALIWYLQSSAGSSGDTTAHSQPPDQGGEGSSIPGHDREQFRELWRSFAQKVRGDRWESSTPGEIQREAIAAGYPAHPVDTLSETFRAVEYGDRPLTASVYEHARIAYRSVAFWHEKDDGGDNS